VSDNRLLVPVSASGALRQTVEYAVEAALEGEDGGTATVRFVYVHPAEFDEENPDEAGDEARALLDRVGVWAREDAGERESDLSVETAHLGADRYIFSPEDVADAIAADARASGIEWVVLDPEYDPGVGAPLVRPLERELEQFDAVAVETAPVTPRVRRRPLLERTSLAQLGALFVFSFGFYQVLAGNFTWLTAGPSDWAGEIYWLDVITGTVAGVVVAVGLSQVVLSTDPTRQTLARLLRTVVYIPYLLVEIIRANVLVALVILHPRLPIDPRLTRVQAALWGPLPITTYANSITLTPGTLSVRVDGRRLLVHTLVPDAREGLFNGGLERAIRFVFYGRAAMNIPSPRDRDVTGIVPSGRVRPDSDTSADTPEGTEDAGRQPDTDSSEGTDDTDHDGATDDTTDDTDPASDGADDTESAAGEGGDDR